MYKWTHTECIYTLYIYTFCICTPRDKAPSCLYIYIIYIGTGCLYMLCLCAKTHNLEANHTMSLHLQRCHTIPLRRLFTRCLYRRKDMTQALRRGLSPDAVTCAKTRSVEACHTMILHVQRPHTIP